MTRARDLADSADKDIAGTLTLDGLTVDKSQNSETNIELTNTNAGSDAQVRTKYTTDGGLFTVGKTSDAHSFGGDAYVHNVDNTNIRFATGDTERLRITSDGKVGIGTGSPDELLHIHGTTQSYIKLTDDDSGEGATDGALFAFDGSSATQYIWNYENGPTVFATNSTERMRIDGSGNVGIGISSISGVKLDVLATVSDNLVARFENSHATGSYGISVKAGDDSGNYAADFANKSGTSLMRIRGDGKVGIGTSSPSATLNLEYSDDTGGNGGLVVKNTSTGTSTNFAGLSCQAVNNTVQGFLYSADYNSWGVGTFLGTGTNHPLHFMVNNAEKMRIDSSGNVGIGTSSPSEKLVLANSSNEIKFGLDGSSHDIFSNGKTFNIGTTDDTVVRMFQNNSEVMRLSGGTVGIGNTISSSFYNGGNNLVVGSGSGSEGITIYGGAESNLFFADGTSLAANLVGRIEYSHGSEKMLFYVNNAYAMSITSGGDLLVGRTSSGATGNGHSIRGGDSAIFSRDASGETMVVCRNDSTGDLIRFKRNSGICGEIVNTGSTSVAYNTSSDYRLKENVTDVTDGITRVKQLAPKRFNFIADGTDRIVDGFLAHEAATVVPEAVTGTKDELEVWKYDEDLPEGVSVGDNKLDNDGNTIPKYQGIDQAKLVPLLTAALQEAIAKIETLESRITALEGA